MVRDAESRNGTFVNGQRADDAVLADGHTVRIGSTEFTFQISDQPPTVQTEGEIGFTQTIVKNLPMFDTDAGGKPTGGGDTGIIALSALRDTDQARQLLVLYQLSIRLLALDHPDEVTQVALDLLREQTRASVVGFLWVDEAGRLKPKMVIPEADRRADPPEPIAHGVGLPAGQRRLDRPAKSRRERRQPVALCRRACACRWFDKA